MKYINQNKMNSQSELEHLKNYKPSIDDLKMRHTFGSFTEFVVDEGDTSNCPPPDKSMKFFSIEVEVITPRGWGIGRYNYMDNNWLVELYGDKTDELQSYIGVTHWREQSRF
jgi:hypothetical protein